MNIEPLSRTTWAKVVDGVTHRSHLREAEPGVYHISAELMELMMRELGWEVES